MFKLKPVALPFLAICMSLFLSACSTDTSNKAPDPSENTKTLKIGMSLSYPPYETTNTDGTPYGLSVDLATELSEYFNVATEIVAIPYDNLVSSLTEGKIDLVISSLPITEERKSSVDFSDPYAYISYAALLPEDFKVTSLDNLNRPNYKIGVKADSSTIPFLEGRLPEAELVTYDSDDLAAQAVVNGEVDAYVQNELVIYKYWKQYPLATHIYFSTKDIAQQWAIAIPKNKALIVEKVNEFLKIFKEDNGFQTLSETYLSAELGDYSKWNQPFIFTEKESK